MLLQTSPLTIRQDLLVTEGGQAGDGLYLVYPGLGTEGGPVEKKNHLPRRNRRTDRLGFLIKSFVKLSIS